MKEFLKLEIEGDTLNVFVKDSETGESAIELAMDLSPFYFAHELDLDHNVFLTDEDWLFGGDFDDEEGEESEEINDTVNDEFMENFCCDVPNEVIDYCEDNNIFLSIEGYEDVEDEHSKKFAFMNDLFEDAIKKALNLDEHWHHIPSEG